MSKMLDAIAKIICRAAGRDPCVGEVCSAYVEAAREVVEAMGRPTAAMLEVSGVRCHGIDIRDGSMRTVCGRYLGESGDVIYQRMIKAALE